MRDLLKDLVAYVCELFGCPDGFEDSVLLGITILFIFFLIISSIWKGILKLVKWRNKRLLNRNLKPYFTKLDVEKYTKYYVTQYYQDISPSNEEEPNPRHISTARQKIVKLFTNEVFKEKSANKYFIVLAGAGMGKTAFMINLYLKHLNSFKNPFSKQKLAIKLFPLGAKDILEKVKSMPNKKNTILLLDALDEDTKALKDYDKRMSTILDVCNEFNIIIITCRTQFFSSEQEEPYETGMFSFGEIGQYYFKKIYLSPFNYKDIKKYINKRFKFYERKKKKDARKIIAKSESLLVRPMLLSHIDDLIKVAPDKLTTLYIYNILVEKWLEREAKKPRIEAKFGSFENYKELLKNFSIQLSKKMYLDRDKRKGLIIHRSSDFKIKGFSFSELEEEFLDNKNNYIKSKSLLNRDSSGNYKFSHKSIFEYFFALNLRDSPELIFEVDYKSFDMTKLFLLDFFRSLKNTSNIFKIFYVKNYTSDFLFLPESSPQSLQKVKTLKYYGINDKRFKSLYSEINNKIDNYIIYCESFNLIYSLVINFQWHGYSDYISSVYNILLPMKVNYEERITLERYLIYFLKREKMVLNTDFVFENGIPKEDIFWNEIIRSLPDFKVFLFKIESIKKLFPEKKFFY